MTQVECERCGKNIAVPVNEWLSVSFADRPFDRPIEDVEEDFISRFTEVQLCEGCAEEFESFLNNGLSESNREGLAVKVWQNSDLTQREVGELLGRSASWVSRAVNRRKSAEEDETSRKFSLEEFAEQRGSQGRQVSVFVKGDPGQDPPKGRATACRVAHILQSGEGSIIDVGEDDVDIDSLAGDSVLIVTATGDEEAWAELRKLATAPFPGKIHIVVHSDEIPEYALRLVDVRVVDDEGIESIGRIQVDGYNGEVYEIEMDGLTANDK